MNAFTISLLTANGWFPSRQADLSPLMPWLTKFEWILFPEGLDFLKSFYGLPKFSFRDLLDSGFISGVDWFSFDASYATDWRKEAQIIERIVGTSLMPVGVMELDAIFIDSDLCFYTIDGDMICYQLGRNLDESMDNLFSGKRMRRIH